MIKLLKKGFFGIKNQLINQWIKNHFFPFFQNDFSKISLRGFFSRGAIIIEALGKEGLGGLCAKDYAGHEKLYCTWCKKPLSENGDVTHAKQHIKTKKHLNNSNQPNSHIETNEVGK